MLIESNYRVAPEFTQQKQVSLTDGSPATQIQFVVVDGAGTAPALDVNMTFETSSGLVWWNFVKAGKVNQSDISQLRAIGTTYPWLIARAPDGRSIVGFLMSGINGTRLAIISSQASAKSLSAAQTVSTDALSQIASRIVDGTNELGTELDLGPYLGRNFFYRQFDASLISKARITRVVASRDGWEISLAGANSETAVVSLSTDFRILTAVEKKN